MVDIRSLEGVSIKELADVFNLAFADYFVPIRLTPEQLNTKLEVENVRLEYSVGVFDGDNLAGLILHGIDERDGMKIVYNGGTGVIPAFRGNALTKKMYQFILPILKLDGFDTVYLEVIDENVQAIKSYLNVGFVPVRKLNCYHGEIKIKKDISDFNIKKIEALDWHLLRSFWDVLPTYQHSATTIDRLKSNTINLGAYKDDRLVGYLILSPGNKKLLQLAVDPNFRRQGIATSLMSAISKTCESIVANNIEQTSEASIAFVQSIGLNRSVTQLELTLDLK